MPVNYKEIRDKNIEEYGKGSRHLTYFADIYTTRTHFIYELLQNTEDALLRRKTGSPEGYIHFNLLRNRLEVRHNGAPFEENENRKDVSGICGIGEGTKAGDYTQIGKFGIGFKSVYAYTFIPQIHSCDEHFELRRFVEPYELNAKDAPSVHDGETCIVLPFDSVETKPEWACRELLPMEQAVQEIGDALRNLGVRSLLFLHKLTEIKWTLPDGGTSGHFLREIKDETPSSKLITVTDGDNIEEWQVFRKMAVIQDGKDSHDITVEVAFRIENGKARRAQYTELVAYFPTEKKTSLGFLIQAPFKTTKARDNIKSDDSANHQIIKIAAQLVADSIEIMRDLNLLDVSSYLALPLSVPEDGFFRTIYDLVRKALREKPLLPGHGGTFIKAEQAKLARGKELVELFSPEQLGLLFGKEKLFWLDASITESIPTADLHAYLIGRKKYQFGKDWEIEPLWDGLLVDADTLSPKLTDDFLDRQPLPWLVEFIQYAAHPQRAVALKRTPFIRLVSGKHVSLPADAAMPRPAWFAPKDVAGLDLSVFPLVHPELAANDDILKFLEKEGIREIDAVAIVEKSVLPKYQDANTCFDESAYRVDLRRICEAYGKANDAAKAQLNTNLNKSAWLACIHAGGNAPDKIVWKKPGASDLFEKTADHETWFDGLEDVNAYFLHPSVIGTLNEAVTRLAKFTALTTNLSTDDRTITLSSEHSKNKQGLNGFDPKATIVGIKSAWANWNDGRCKVLWKFLLTAPLKIISGETRFAKNYQKLDKAQREIEYTEVGKLCRKQTWLIDKSGNRRKPSELLLTDLPEGFESTSMAAKEVAEKLGMKQPEREQALDAVTGGDPDFKMLIEHYQSASDDERKKILKIIPREVLPEPPPSFKDGLKNLARPQRGIIEHGDKERPPVFNPDRYQEKLSERVEEGVEEHQSTPRKITFSPLRDLPANVEARGILYEEYQGRCQVTGMTFPKASRNAVGMAENYFEACSLLSYRNADYLNDAGSMLCVSADTMAKFNCASITFMDSLEDAIATFKANGKRAESVSVKIQLAGDECSIKWSQRHFMRLVALYEKA